MHNSRLWPVGWEIEPRSLRRGVGFQGCNFPVNRTVVMPNGAHTTPYLGGKEFNTHPQHRHHRWCDERDARANSPGMMAALDNHRWVLASIQTTKHVCFGFIESCVVPQHTMYVFTLDRNQDFAVLQNRIHTTWAEMLCSTLRSTIQYTVTDAFDTYPLPKRDKEYMKTTDEELEGIGKRLYDARAEFMTQRGIGLTKAYNLLKDASVTDEDVVALRRLHEAVDLAVLRAYGWDDLAAQWPPYEIPLPDALQFELVRRLGELNAECAAEEST